MEGNLLMAARADAAKIASAGGFQVSAVLSTPDNSVQLPVVGLGSGTWMVFENLQSGKIQNGTSNSFTIPADQLIIAGYPYLKGNRCDLKGHYVTVTDTQGMAGTFVINEQHPNTTLGLIPCILGHKKAS